LFEADNVVLQRLQAGLLRLRRKAGSGASAHGIDLEPKRNQNGSIHSVRTIMALTLTLKNIPDEVYRRLKASAESHRRSMNSEAIVCLEAALRPGRVNPEERLARARALRARLPDRLLDVEALDAIKREGRP
jgi:antitoxin FitA